jgi:kinesin family protein 4/21/27
VVSTLRKEIASRQEANVKITQHTAELESRLIHSETHSQALVKQIDRYEKEVEGHEKAYKDLESHIALLDTTHDNKALLEELQQRELRIIEMEKEYREKHATLEQEKLEIQAAHEASSLANSRLRAEVDKINASSSSQRSEHLLDAESSTEMSRRPPLVSKDTVFETPPESPSEERPNIETDEVAELRRALRSLTAKYHESEARYSEAEVQIHELSTQLADARLIHAEVEDVVPSSPATHRSSVDENSDESMTLQTPKEEQEAFNTSPSKSNRGGHRGSMPNLSLLTKGRDFRAGRGVIESRRARYVSPAGFAGQILTSRPQSLSQELSSAHSPGLSSRPSWGGPSTLLLAPAGSRQSMPMIKSSRSLQSLEAELRFVHEVSLLLFLVVSRANP